MSGDHNMYCGGSSRREITIHLVDDYAGHDLKLITSVGVDIGDVVSVFKSFLLAAGFAPDNVKEYFNDE